MFKTKEKKFHVPRFQALFQLMWRKQISYSLLKQLQTEIYEFKLNKIDNELITLCFYKISYIFIQQFKREGARSQKHTIHQSNSHYRKLFHL